MSELPKLTEEITETLPFTEILDKSQIKLKKIDFSKKLEKGRHKNFHKVIFTECLFSKETINEMTFQNCTFIKCQFNGTIINNSEFHQCKFDNCCFYKTKIISTYIDPSSFKFNSEWYIKWSNVNVIWFQALFKNSKLMHQENFAMAADIKFQFYRRYDHLFGQKKHPFLFIWRLLYDMCLGCGYGIMNTLIFTIIFISLFATLIMPWIKINESTGIIESIYFSVVSFTTVGYGEITPVHDECALIITTLFLFLSFVWGSIVTAVIVKRVVK